MLTVVYKEKLCYVYSHFNYKKCTENIVDRNFYYFYEKTGTI